MSPRARVTSKWQITVPKEVRLLLDAGMGETIYFRLYERESWLPKQVELTTIEGTNYVSAKINKAFIVCIPDKVRKHLSLSIGDYVVFGLTDHLVFMRRDVGEDLLVREMNKKEE